MKLNHNLSYHKISSHSINAYVVCLKTTKNKEIVQQDQVEHLAKLALIIKTWKLLCAYLIPNTNH